MKRRRMSQRRLDEIVDEIWAVMDRHGLDGLDRVALLGSLVEGMMLDSPDPATLTAMFVARLEEGVAGAPGA